MVRDYQPPYLTAKDTKCHHRFLVVTQRFAKVNLLQLCSNAWFPIFSVTSERGIVLKQCGSNPSKAPPPSCPANRTLCQSLSQLCLHVVVYKSYSLLVLYLGVVFSRSSSCVHVTALYGCADNQRPRYVQLHRGTGLVHRWPYDAVA